MAMFYHMFYHMLIMSKNKIGVFEDENTPVVVKKSRSLKKKMIAVFFKPSRVMLAQKTVTVKWYIELCLSQIIESLKIVII